MLYLEDYLPFERENNLNTKKGIVIDAAGKFFKDNGVILPKYEFIIDNQNQTAVGTYDINHTVYVNDNVSGTYQVAGVTATFGTTSTSGTLNVEVATGTQAIASGTNQMSSAISLSGTANTPVNGTITTQTVIAAGSRVNLIFAGTRTGLANASITVVLQRLS